ncbi:MAG: PG0541 family transporter-associated protein, partial [Desulfobacterales bacterium]
MKMVMIICPENRNEELRELIAKHDIHAYTELKEITGEGATGKKFGSRIWPEKSVLVFTVISNE